MTNMRKIRYQRIFLFTDKKQAFETNSLKEFLSFLKNHEKSAKPSFSYSNGDSLHQNLSIYENLILDSLPRAMGMKDSEQVESFIQNQKNPYIIKLYNLIEKDLHSLVSSVSIKTKKISCFISKKGLSVIYFNETHSDHLFTIYP